MNIYIFVSYHLFLSIYSSALSTSHKGSGTLTWGDKWWLALVKKATVAWGRRELYHKPNHMWPSSPLTVHHRLVARNMCGSYFVIVSQTSQCPFFGCRVGQSIIIGKESIRKWYHITSPRYGCPVTGVFVHNNIYQSTAAGIFNAAHLAKDAAQMVPSDVRIVSMEWWTFCWFYPGSAPFAGRY